MCCIYVKEENMEFGFVYPALLQLYYCRCCKTTRQGFEFYHEKTNKMVRTCVKCRSRKREYIRDNGYYCEACKVNLSNHYWPNHLKTEKHKSFYRDFLIQKQRELEAQAQQE